MEKCEQGRDEKIYRSVAFTRRSTKTCGKVVLVKRQILSTPFFGKVMVHKFKSVYVPKPYISVDESLIAYKGRLSWKQYIPQKRARFGIKLFQLCESESGYIWNSLIYTGKGTAFNENYNDYGLSTKSVLTLIHELKGKGYCLSTDNFYTSPELAELLIDSKTDICGTLRPNRKGLPVLLKSSTLKKGEIIAFQKGKMCVLKWKDKKPLHMLSTFHNADMMEVKAKKGDSVKLKPKAVVFYNYSMGGVDRSDQCLSYYHVARNQQRKYYKKIFRHLLNQIVGNSFVIFKKNGGILNHIGFRMKLIERLIEEGGSDSIYSSRNFVSPKISENVVRLVGRHFPSYVESDCSKKKKKNIAKMYGMQP
ncbi:piggyBac transposable element-derived protein 4 [Trichonephila clavipes]|nr:piggyBac transposable element-derived protein 4 [Trichonephila clavipes]